MFRKLLYLILIVCCWYLFNTWQVYNYSKNYSEEPADVAIVLGAGTSNGKLSQVFVERLNHAVYLLDNEFVSAILITGGYGIGQSISDSKAAKDFIILKGVQEESIFIEEESKITYFNILNAKKIMTEQNWDNALIVSDPYHMKRAMAMCNRVELSGQSSPTQTSMYRSRNVKRKFLLNQGFQYTTYHITKWFRPAK